LAGEILKARREDLCLNIKEIADRLRIRPDYLSAIEDDFFDKLPAPVYTMGYIRCYAAYLGIDAESLVQFYGAHLSRPKHSAIIPVAHFRKRSPKAVYIVLVLLVLAASLFARSHVASRSASKPATGTGKVTVAKTVQDQRNDYSQGGAVSQGPGHDLSVTAVDRTWILISFNDGRKEEMVLRPGEIKSWSFTDKVSLRIGNAGGIKVIFDGKDMGVPGLSGQVKSLSFPDNQKSNG